MAHQLDPTPAVHTWSLFRTMGRYVAPGSAPSGTLAENTEGGGLPLLELPGELAAHGFRSAQLCHFYLPSTEDAYLGELCSAFDEAGVDLECFLVDDGDLVDPDRGAEQRAWISGWIDVAERLGAPRVRVPAGDRAPSEETLRASAEGLRALAAEHSGIRVLTENWKSLLVDEKAVRRLLELVEGEVGLLIDTGNWDDEEKYRRIGAVAGVAECSQVKARESAPGVIDEEDLQRSLAVLREVEYAGRLSLVYAGTDDDEWGRLAQLREIAAREIG